MKLPFKTLSYIARHPLASKRPIHAFYRYAWWQVSSRLQDEIEFDWIEGSKLLVKRGMTGATGNIYCGLHEFADMAFLLHLLRPDDLFVDVGANIGSYSILASAVCGAGAIAIEPDPGTMAALKRNIELNGQVERVERVQAALGAVKGTGRFTIGRDTMNQIADQEDEASQEVELLTLDEVVGQKDPTLIKMDVEGYEAEVVAGGLSTLASDSLLAIISENADKPVRDPIEANGFRLCSYRPYSREIVLDANSEPRSTNNFLFVRDIEAVRARVSSARKREVAGLQI